MKSILLLAGTDNSDEKRLYESATSGTRTVDAWSTVKGASKGDEVWFYFPAPISAVCASGKATADAKASEDWPYMMPVGDLEWFREPVTLSELRAQFPDWGWTQTARGRTYLSEAVTTYLRERRHGAAPKILPSLSGVKRSREVIHEAAAAYRLNWNPDTNPDDLTQVQVSECERFGYVDTAWRCGNTRIESGQRLFLMRTGSGSRGVIGVGRAINDASERLVSIRLRYFLCCR